MNNILQISTIFLAQLGFGSAIILPFFPIKVTGKSFLRFYYGLIIAFLSLFLICLYRLDQFSYNYLIFLILAVWIMALSFGKVFTRIEQFLMWFFAFCSLLILFLYPQRIFQHEMSNSMYLMTFGLLLIASIFLSFYLMTMIFGHWYLVNRSLPINHLIKTSRNLMLFSYLRLISVGFSTYWAYHTMSTASFDRLIDFMGHGVFFWARLLAGIGLPLVVSHLAYESAKIKSNQSATGILYAGTIFVLMGEIMALYLFSITGIMF